MIYSYYLFDKRLREKAKKTKLSDKEIWFLKKCVEWRMVEKERMKKNNESKIKSNN